MATKRVRRIKPRDCFFSKARYHDGKKLTVEQWKKRLTDVKKEDSRAFAIVKKIIEEEWYPKGKIAVIIRKVPPFVQNLIVPSLSQEGLDYCLASTLKDVHLIRLLLGHGANPNYIDPHCGVNLFERASSLEVARMMRDYGVTANKKVLKMKILYKIVTVLAADKLFDDKTEFHRRRKFVLSRYHNAYRCEDGIIRSREDNSRDFELAIQFLEEVDIPFELHDADSKTINELNIRNVKEIVRYVEQEYLIFIYRFPRETKLGEENKGEILPGAINYWCWKDHTPGLETMIGKYHMI